MSHLENDHKALAFISPKLFAVEADLFDKKWWDYRLLHPVEATELFSKAYVLAAKSYLCKQVDLYIGVNARVLKKEDFFLESKAIITGMWKARQLADTYGVPYSFWCQKAMEYADQCCWPYYPKPSHLYSCKTKETAGELEGLSMLDYILGKWEEWTRMKIVTAELEFYRDSINLEHPYFSEYQLALIRQIQRSNVPEHALAIHLYDNHDLFIEYAKKHFSEPMLTRAKHLSG